MDTAIQIHHNACAQNEAYSGKVIPLTKSETLASCLLKDIVHSIIESRPSIHDRTIVHDVLDQCAVLIVPMSREDSLVSWGISAFVAASMFIFSFCM